MERDRQLEMEKMKQMFEQSQKMLMEQNRRTEELFRSRNDDEKRIYEAKAASLERELQLMREQMASSAFLLLLSTDVVASVTCAKLTFLSSLPRLSAECGYSPRQCGRGQHDSHASRIGSNSQLQHGGHEKDAGAIRAGATANAAGGGVAQDQVADDVVSAAF